MRASAGRPIGAVMFDFDGTLIDTMGDFADLAGELIARHHGGTEAEGRAAYLRTSGIPFFQQLELLYPGHEKNPGIVEEFEYEKLRFYEGKGLFPDVAPALDALRSRGVRTVVSSNNYQAVVDRFLETQEARFDLVLGYHDNFAKGEEHFSRAAQVLSISRDALMFVGDSVRDAELAEASRVRFAARKGTAPVEAFVRRFGDDPFPMIDTLDDVLPIVDASRGGA